MKIELSIPFVLGQSSIFERTEWRLPNGDLHRDFGPAQEYYDGSKIWFQYGKKHRKNGPAIEFSDGKKEWLLNNKHHRIDGPAILYNDGKSKEWWVHGQKHCEHGPAIELYADHQERWNTNNPVDDFLNFNSSLNIIEYWINGTQMTLKEFQSLKKL